jgi:hypothetical protein
MHNESIAPHRTRHNASVQSPASVQEVDQIYQGDAFALLKIVPDNCIDMVMTSPTFWQLRGYGVAGQLGLEPTIEESLSRHLAIVDAVPGCFARAVVFAPGDYTR